jgi:multidrug resistance efflux pump
MRINSLLKPKHMVWASGAVLAVILLIVMTRSGAKASVQAPPPPIVEVATVEQRDVPVYGEWIGTLTGQVNADVKAQVTGYLLTRKYKEGSYVRKGELLFEIDPRPFQAALDQAKAQLAQAKAQLAQAKAQLTQDQAQLATAQANQMKSQLDVDKYAPLAAVDAVSKQDFDNADQTNLANKNQTLAAKAAIASAEAQIQVSEAGVETAGHQPRVHTHCFPD